MAKAREKETSALEKANRRADEELVGFDKALKILKELRESRDNESGNHLENRRKTVAS